MDAPTSQYFEQDNKLFLKTFLLDSSVNVNNWGVSPTTLATNIRSFIGKPLVLQDDFGHPMSEDNYDHHLQYQESFRIGNIIDIVNKDGIYSAIIEVTDTKASDAFKAGNLPLYVSPQIYHYAVGTEPDDMASGWKGTHLAIVNEPAFGVKKARVVSQCSGDLDTCSAQLKKAAIEKTKCNCVKQAIANYKVVTNSKHESHSSLGINKQNILVAEDIANVQTIPLEEFEKLKTENASLKTALSEKDTVTSQLKSSYDEALKRIDSIEKNTRNEKIANILSGVKFETDEERQKKIETLVNSNLEVSFIDDTYKPLREANTAATIIKQATVESKLELKQGNNNVEEHSGVPDWLVTFRNSGGSA